MNRARRRALYASFVTALGRAHARYAFAVPLAFALALYTVDALARPGGGHSFSSGSSGSSYSGGRSSFGSSSRGGGGSSSSSGGGDGGGLVGALVEIVLEIIIRALIELLIYLFSRYPQVMIPLTLGIAAAVFLYVKVQRWLRAPGWSTGGDPNAGYLDRLAAWRWMRSWDRDGELTLAIPTERVEESPGPSARELLRRAVGDDEHFSAAGFQDFVQGLYAAVHDARGRRALANFAPYVSVRARATLEMLMPTVTEVQGVVVGSLGLDAAERFERDGRAFVRTIVTFRANYTERAELFAAPRSFYAIERWTLERRADAKTRKPEGARTFGCPNCGAPLDRAYQSECAYCHEPVEGGAFDWCVASVVSVARERTNPLLSETVQEQGTALPTVLGAGVAAGWESLRGRDPALTEAAFAARVSEVFHALQDAWSTRQWSRARAYLTDSAYDSMRYWIEMYEAAHQRNVTAEAKLRRLDLVRVERDGPLDAVTVRLYASSLDYTVRAESEEVLVAGSKTDRRRYTEYWTFVRSKEAKGAPRAEPRCPKCGAELKVTMAGECEYCGARVVSGEFDWVLSRIEQDDVYAG